MWATPFAKWRTRAGELARLQMPTVPVAADYAQPALPVSLCVMGMYKAPRARSRLERDGQHRQHQADPRPVGSW